MKRNLIFATILSLLFYNSCSTSNKTKGAIIGTVIGGTAGAVLTKKNKSVGIILGAATGGILGGLIGNYMDKAANEIHKELGNDATVTRVEEGIVVSFDSGLLFDHDSYILRNQTKTNLIKLTNVLNEYKETNITILGHTDNTGTASYNNELSLKRASNVATFLSANQIENSRLKKLGFGESDPVATNETNEGRQLNRRVEIVLVANNKLKKELNN